jgi:hypothetical protein
VNVTQFTTAQGDAWREALVRFAPNDDVYFQPEYALAYEANGDGFAQATLVTEGNAALFVPVLRCPAPDGDVCDIQGAYGYGGPLAVGATPEFLSRAWSAIRENWRALGAVAAFVPCHPLIANDQWFDSEWQVAFDRPTVSVDLSSGAAEAFVAPWACTHRRNVARAERAGCTVRFCAFEKELLEEFRLLYEQTMVRLGAGRKYFFSPEYFAVFARHWRGTASLVEVRDAAGALASGAVIFWGKRWAHYHLGARQAGPENQNTFHLLFQRVVEESERRGLLALHLGGGRTPQPDDSLLHFKRRVGRCAHRFCTGRLVIDGPRYHQLVSEWQLRHPESSPILFLTYRQHSDTH